MAIEPTLYLCADHQFDSAHVGTLSAYERERARQFVNELDGQRFVLARAVLRWALSEQLGERDPADWQIIKNGRGRPVLDDREHQIGFSISHTDGLVAVLLSSVSVCGVDIESLGRQVDVRKLAQRYCSIAEIEWLDDRTVSEQPQAFLKLWTLKEAYLKATGQGISVPLKQLSFEVKKSIRLLDSADPSRSDDHWSFKQWAHDGSHMVAVAQETGEMSLRVVSLTANTTGFEFTLKAERTA